MGEIHYLISDASKKVDVEAHVLRYWEEELELQIPRNEMGHRYYTDGYISLFRHIKELKDNGYQLKAIKSNLPKLMALDDNTEDIVAVIDPLSSEVEVKNTQPTEDMESPAELIAQTGEHDVAADDKMAQFQTIMGNIISKAIRENTELMGQEVGNRVSDKVIKEMDYLMRMRDEKEDERYKKLDETLRAYQKGHKARAEAAATKVPGAKPAKKKRFGRSGNKLF